MEKSDSGGVLYAGRRRSRTDLEGRGRSERAKGTAFCGGMPPCGREQPTAYSCVQIFAPTEHGETVVLAVGETGQISLTRHTGEAAASSAWITNDQGLYDFLMSLFFP